MTQYEILLSVVSVLLIVIVAIFVILIVNYFDVKLSLKMYEKHNDDYRNTINKLNCENSTLKQQLNDLRKALDKVPSYNKSQAKIKGKEKAK